MATPGGVATKLADLARDGVVWTRREFADDVNGIGAPILGPDGAAVGAINVYGPTYRFPGDRPEAEIGRLVSDACGRIAARLTDR